jgi:hypothetical protein
MKIRYDRFLPLPYELLLLIFVDVLLLIVGNARRMIDYYGLHNSDTIIRSGAGTVVTGGLSKIDRFSFTDPVVTFGMWALIGIFCFSAVQGIVRIYHEVEDDKELSSNDYVHPDSFVRRSFWERILLDFVTAFVCMLLIIAGLIMLWAFVLPTSLEHARAFLLGVSFVHLVDLMLSLVIMYAWLVVFYVLVKTFVNRHRLLASSH